MLVDYIEKVANEKRFDVILVPYDSFDPGQFEVISKLIKRGTDIVPVMFGVHYRTKEKCPFIGLETYEAFHSIPQMDLQKMARKWKGLHDQIIDTNGKRVLISDWLTDDEDFTDSPICNWKSDEYVKGWNACLDEVFNSGMA